jgi:hypothetical protein
MFAREQRVLVRGASDMDFCFRLRKNRAERKGEKACQTSAIGEYVFYVQVHLAPKVCSSGRFIVFFAERKQERH